jgi:hypothetical protein
MLAAPFILAQALDCGLRVRHVFSSVSLILLNRKDCASAATGTALAHLSSVGKPRKDIPALAGCQPAKV